MKRVENKPSKIEFSLTFSFFWGGKGKRQLLNHDGARKLKMLHEGNLPQKTI